MIARTASFRLGRSVRFVHLETRLLSRNPTVTVTGLTIANPTRFNGGDLAEVGRLTAHLRIWPLLTGGDAVSALEVDRIDLHLIRFGPSNNNWSNGKGGGGPAFAPLSGVASLVITNGHLDLTDHARDMVVRADFSDRPGAALPFRMAGAGVLRGGPIRFGIAGGPLHGEAVGLPYPFVADLVDGRTIMHAHGASGDAFDLTRYALAVSARGPNLADIGYVFNLITPNSAPYRLTSHAVSDGAHLAFDGLDLRTARSHVTGRIWSDHSAARREVRAVFVAPVLARSDIDAMLAPLPSRVAASVESGELPLGIPSHWLISDAPISLRRLRGADFDFQIRIGRLDGYALPLTDIVTRTDLDHGILDVPTFRARLASGRLNGSARLDASRPRPTIAIRGAATDMALSGLSAGGGAAAPGVVSLALDLAGSGNSLHDAAASATGRLDLRAAGAVIPRQAGWMLGGDLLRAAFASKQQTIVLTCADARFRGTAGRLAVERLSLGTALGDASGQGTIDLGSETFSLLLDGHPTRRRLFQASAPVQIGGPWLKPSVTVLPGRKARALGLRGTIGVALTPLVALLPIGGGARPVAGCR